MLPAAEGKDLRRLAVALVFQAVPLLRRHWLVSSVVRHLECGVGGVEDEYAQVYALQESCEAKPRCQAPAYAKCRFSLCHRPANSCHVTSRADDGPFSVDHSLRLQGWYQIARSHHRLIYFTSPPLHSRDRPPKCDHPQTIMYRTGDPRFRRRLNEIGQTLESANVTAQSGLYDFSQHYILPCFTSITSCFTTCIDASCPTLNLTASQRDRIRRQRGRSRGRAELTFDFYDDWDEDENDALMGWGNDEFDRLLAGSGGYGTVAHTTQPGRPRGMSYPKGRRKSAVQPHDGGPDPTIIPGSSLFGKLFGGKALRYKPSAAGLQDHPGATRDVTEGEALLRDGEEGARRKHERVRRGTASSGHTTDSLSSRGDIFPSDEEDDAIPLDDEFAMVLERRTTLSGPETESSSGKTRSTGERRQGKRPSAGSRASTYSSRSARGRQTRSSTNSSAPQTPIDEAPPSFEEAEVPTLNELKQEEQTVEQEEEQEVERKRQEAQKLASERGLSEDLSSKEATPQMRSPTLEPVQRSDERGQLPTPLAIDDEDDAAKKGIQDPKT